MTGFDAIVIGGGVNGLVAATVLARRGRRVCLLERSGGLGGLAAPAPDGSARFAHLLYNLSPVVRRDIGIRRPAWPFATVPLPAMSLCEEGRHVVLRGRTASLADGTAHPSADAARLLLGRLTRYGALLRRLAEHAPPGLDLNTLSTGGLREALRLGRFGLALRGLGTAEMRRFLHVLLSNAADLILDEMPDGPLAGLLAADAVRGAAAGPRSPGTVFSLIYRYGHGDLALWPTGGMGAVVDAFAAAAERAGCTLRTGAPVARILIEADRVAGVALADGERLAAPLVLTSGGALQTARLAGLTEFDIEATRRFSRIRARGTVAKLNLRLDARPHIPGPGDLPEGARLVIAPSVAHVERAFEAAKYGAISPAPVVEAVLPPATEGAAPLPLSVVAQYAPVDLDGGWTDGARDGLRDGVLAAFDRVSPGFSDRVIDAEVLSPDLIEAETGAPGGHWHHAEMSLDQILSVRPASGIGRYAMGPRGLYLCGASAHPGGDVMGLAGRNAALAALGAAA